MGRLGRVIVEDDSRRVIAVLDYEANLDVGIRTTTKVNGLGIHVVVLQKIDVLEAILPRLITWHNIGTMPVRVYIRLTKGRPNEETDWHIIIAIDGHDVRVSKRLPNSLRAIHVEDDGPIHYMVGHATDYGIILENGPKSRRDSNILDDVVDDETTRI